MVLSAVSPYLIPVGNAAMWARFIDQTVDRSTSCLRNANIAQVALHQIALIGLNFCFLNHLGYISLASPLVGGLCVVPIFWVAICWGQQMCQIREKKRCSLLEAFGPAQERSVIRIRIGLEMIMRVNICVSIAAAALFALSGYLVFAAVFGSFLVVSQLRRMNAFSFRVRWGSESFEFVISSIAAVLIGTWYHRLRAVFDISLRLRDYYKLSIRTEPIVPKAKLYTEFLDKEIKKGIKIAKRSVKKIAKRSVKKIAKRSVKKIAKRSVKKIAKRSVKKIAKRSVKKITACWGEEIDKKIKKLMKVSNNGEKLIPTAEHLDWPNVEFPDKPPEDINLKNCEKLAKEVFRSVDLLTIHRALKAYDDNYAHSNEPYDNIFKLHESITEYVSGKIKSWFNAVKEGNPCYPKQTKSTQIYVLWIYKELENKDSKEKARIIIQLMGSFSENWISCPEQIINIVELLYLSLVNPNTEVVSQVASYLLQGLRRHILHRFLYGLQKKYPTWVIRFNDRHVMNLFLSIINQKGMRLGLKEEDEAGKDTYYSGSVLVETALWVEALEFETFFLNQYTAQAIASTIQTCWKETFKDAFNKWVVHKSTLENLSDKQSKFLQNAVTSEGTLKQENLYSLLVHMGVLTLSKETLSQLQENNIS